MSALDPRSDRIAFTDAVRPPPGYVLDVGVGTTFSLDFEAFTAIVLAFVGADLGDAKPDAASVLTAVARLKDRLQVFVNAGGYDAPKLPNRLFALYDRITRDVDFEGSAFHPKVWVLKFAPQAKPELRKARPIYRVLCASRNVTDSRCWELVARFDGTAGKGSELGRDVAQFCKRLARRSSAQSATWRLLSELPKVDFEHGRETEQGLRFHWQWPGDTKLGKVLPASASRALLVSPFVRGDFLGQLVDRVNDLTLVSTQAELDALSDAMHERLRNVTTYVVTGEGTDDVPGLDLHAKLLAWEGGNTRETLLGSANATGAAWGMGRTNCEAMVALRPGLRIDELLRAFVEPKDGELAPWIEEYRRQTPEVDAQEEAKRRLEGIQRGIAGVRLEGSHDAATEVLRLTGVGSAPAALATSSHDVEIEISPLLRSGNADGWAPLAGAFGKGLHFEQIGRADLCAFAVVRLRDVATSRTHRFGIQFRLNLPRADVEARDDALHAKLLENVNPRTLLLNVLRGLPAGTGLVHDGAGGLSRGAAVNTGALLSEATLERVLEVCTADRSRIDEVDAVLRAYRSAEDMQSFVEFWSAFKTALQEEPHV
jgi:hypothetical protein